MALTLTMEEEQAAGGKAPSPDTPPPRESPPTQGRAGLTYRQDSTGRRIGLRPLDALLRFRMRRIAGPQDSQNPAAMIDYLSAAAAAEIDGTPENPPRTLQQVEAIINQLGNDGMEVAGQFVLEQIGVTQEMLDDAKNSRPTTS